MVLELLLSPLMKMQSLICLCFFGLGVINLEQVSLASTDITDTHVLSFKVWKQKKIDEARSNVTETKKKIKNSESHSDSFKQELVQSEVTLKVAQDLSANDYFLLYIVPRFPDNPQALVQASKHLSAKDFADILRAYQKTLEGGEVLGSNQNMP